MLVILFIVIDRVLTYLLFSDGSDIISNDDIKKSMDKVIQKYYFKDNQVLLDDTYS